MSRKNDDIREKCVAIVRANGPQSRQELAARLKPTPASTVARALTLSRELVGRYDPVTGILRYHLAGRAA